MGLGQGLLSMDVMMLLAVCLLLYLVSAALFLFVLVVAELGRVRRERSAKTRAARPTTF